MAQQELSATDRAFISKAKRALAVINDARNQYSDLRQAVLKTESFNKNYDEINKAYSHIHEASTIINQLANKIQLLR